MTRPFLSLVIPAYNEAVRITATLEQATAFLGAQDYTWEIIVADDGSVDATPQLLDDFAAGHNQVRPLRLEHRGKGWAVKQGMLAAEGEYRFLCDADLSMPVEQVQRFLPPQLRGVDVAVGSRELAKSRRIGEPFRRRLMGRFFNTIIRLLVLPGLRDTQCGFKCFRGEVADRLFRKQELDGFAFDVEVLCLARQQGFIIDEVAIDWHYREGSKVRPVHDAIRMTQDVLKIRRRLAP